MASLWSLCLVSSFSTSTSNNGKKNSSGSRSSSNNRKIVKVNPESDTIGDLYRIASEAFGENAAVESLKAGFPPQILDSEDTTTLVDSKKVANQERVQVLLTAKSGDNAKRRSVAATNAHGKSKSANAATSTAESDSSPPSKRPKRAAAQAASDSFSDVIREQDRMLKAEKKGAKKPKRAASSSTKNSKSNSNNAKQQLPKPNPKFKSQAPGRRLADGAVVGSPAKKSQPKPVRSSITSKARAPSLPAEKKKYEDISVALLDSLTDKGAMGSILRKGIASQVQNSYETTKATVRMAALSSRSPQTSVQMERIQDNSKLKVKFEKGVQGRGYYEEIVDWIPLDVLRQVIAAIHKSNQEGLRPHNLAFLSPRVLWALAFDHWEMQRKQQQQQDGPSAWQPFSIEAAYQKLLPDYDWSFLRRRKQTLSAKAMENLRQQKEEEGESEDDHEKAADAIQDVEHAMESLQQYDRKQRADRVANAALARLQQHQQGPSDPNASFEIATPSELDEDELIECISSSSGALKNPRELAKGLVEWASIHNWRELANQHPAHLHGCITNHDAYQNVTEEQVEAWIGHAREESINEIIFEICDSNSTHVEVLRDKGRAGAPKDLAGWKAMPDLLFEELGEAAPQASLTLDDINRYCERSSRAMEQFEWLNWYATPIE